MNQNLPNRSYLLQCFDYNPGTGILRWKARPESHFTSSRIAKASNTQFAGQVVGRKSLQVRINHTPYLVARVIYAIMGEIIPEGMEIDHRDRNAHNNKWKNLRLATRSQNVCNRLWRNNLLPKGVTRKGSKYGSKIVVDGRFIYLGRFETPEQAHQAYCDASKKYHGEWGCAE